MAKITPGQRRAGQLLRYKAVQRLVLARGRKPKELGPAAHPARVAEVASCSVYVTDLARSRAFYESVVGLEAGETVGPYPIRSSPAAPSPTVRCTGASSRVA